MTREEIDKIASNYLNDCESESDMFEVFALAKEALEQEPILDKIRAEIAATGAYEQEVLGKTGFLKGIDYCLAVIDRYKAGSEDKE